MRRTGHIGSGRADGVEASGRKAEEEHPEGLHRSFFIFKRHNGAGCHATCTLVQGVLQYDGLGTCRLAKWRRSTEKSLRHIPADFIDDLNKRKTL